MWEIDKPKRAGVYCRLSYAADGSEEKVDRQEDDCRDLGARLKWGISEDHIFKDPSRSAWQRNRKRPGWDAMLAAIERGEIDGIIVYHGDRLVRQPYDLELLLRLADERHLQLASVSGTRDLNSADDRYILRIEAAQACRESDNTSRRVKRALAARAAEGRPRPGGIRPFGFERDNMTIREDEARLIREAAERLLAGQGVHTLIRWLNQAGVRTPKDGLWSSKSLKDLLRRPRVAGLLEREGRIVGPAVWDPILDHETWAAVCRLLDDRAAMYTRDDTVRYLLSGIARCGTCGAGLQVRQIIGAYRNGRYLVYACRNMDGCAHRVTRSVEHLDNYVIGAVLARLADPMLHRELTRPRDEGARDVAAQILALEERKRQTRERFAASDVMSPEELEEILSKLTERIVELRARQRTSARQRLLLPRLGITREQWDDIPLDERRAIIKALLRVTVLPATWRGRGFEEESVVLAPLPADDTAGA